MKVIFCNVCHF